MNTDIVEGKWKQMRGQVKEWWGKLTDDDFDVIAGKKDKLIGKLQEKYGWAKRRCGGRGDAAVPRHGGRERCLPADAGTGRRKWPSQRLEQARDTRESEGRSAMRYMLRSMLALAVLMAFTAGCTSMTGKSAGRERRRRVTITASVKTKLAAEKPATLTKVDVDTNKGTVYLTGNVENPAIKARATELAQQVSGVREVVNNLKIQ